MPGPLDVELAIAEARDAADHFERKIAEARESLKGVSDPERFGPGVRAPFIQTIRFYEGRLNDARTRIRRLSAQRARATA